MKRTGRHGDLPDGEPTYPLRWLDVPRRALPRWSLPRTAPPMDPDALLGRPHLEIGEQPNCLTRSALPDQKSN